MDFIKKRFPISPIILLVICAMMLTNCVWYSAMPVDKVPFMERAETKTDGGVKVTVSVLSDKESKKIFGVPLAHKAIQPMWVSIANNENTNVCCLMV